MSKYQKNSIGPLEVLEVPGSKEGLCIILFHGYGADAADLFSLSEIIPVPEGTRWIFPNGTEEVNLGGGHWGRAWFPINFREFEIAASHGAHLDLSVTKPPELVSATQNALEMIAELKCESKKIILGGFSQGSVLALNVTFHMKEIPAGVTILSGTLTNSKEWEAEAPKRKGLRFYQSHGRSDPLLSFEKAKELEKLLLKSGLRGQLFAFDGGHEIPPMVINQLSSFIQKSHTLLGP